MRLRSIIIARPRHVPCTLIAPVMVLRQNMSL